MIKNPNKFKELIPFICDTKNYDSFIRQLNVYGFKKIKNRDKLILFKNPLFKKGRKKQIAKIQRQETGFKKEQSFKKTISNELNFMGRVVNKIEGQIEHIKSNINKVCQANSVITRKLKDFQTIFDKRVVDITETFLLLLIYLNDDMLNKIGSLGGEINNYDFLDQIKTKDDLIKMMEDFEFFEKTNTMDVNNLMLCPPSKKNAYTQVTKFVKDYASNYDKPDNYEEIKSKMLKLTCNHIIKRKSYTMVNTN